MLLDNWLAQRAETCPDRTGADRGRARDGLRDARGRGRLGRPPAGRQGGAPRLGRGDHDAGRDRVRRGAARADEAGGDRGSRSTRGWAAPSAAAPWGEDQPALTLSSAEDLEGPEADLPLLGEIDLDATCTRVLTSGTAGLAAPGRAHLRQPPLERGRLGLQPRGRPRATAGSAARRSATSAGLSILLRSAIYGTTAVVHDGFDVDRVAESLQRDGVTIVSLVTTMLTRLLDAGAAIERPRALLVGGGPGPRRGPGRGARPRRHRRPDLRPDRGLLAGDHAGARGRRAQARLGGPAAADHARPHRRRRDPGPGPDRGARAPPTRTAGCTPATRGGSTPTASSGSRAAATT